MRAVLLLVALLGASAAWAADDVVCSTYVVQSGDSLWSIASTFGVQPEDLQAALQQCVGYTPGSPLAVGQKICLPGWVPACDYVIDSGDVPNCKIYQIQVGDTIGSVASTFGLYTPDLASLNADIITGVLQVGKFIRLPPWNDAKCPDPDSDATQCRVYTVQAGDFVFGIASVFRVSMADLLAVNPGLQSNTVLQAGQRVRIPPFEATCGNGIISVPPTTGVFSCRAYRVKPADSLSHIAVLFQTTVASLVSVNPELNDPSLLTPGKIIKIAPYPAECINGILIDPSSSGTVAVPAGPIASPAPAPAGVPSPSPAATPSPSPAPVATPSPAATPSPTPAVVPAPSQPAAPAPTQGVRVSMTLSGISPSAFTSTKSAQLSAALANLLCVPTTWVSVSATLPSRRRLQAAGEATALVISVAAADPVSTSAKLQSAFASGAFAQLLSQLGLVSNSLSFSTYGTPTATPSPSPAAPTPTPTSPAPTTAATSGGDGSSNVGAIVGGVVGGVGGAIVAAGVAWFVVKRRRAAAAAGEGGLRTSYAGASANVTMGGGLSVKTQANKLAMDTGLSSSPRGSTVTPRTRAGQMA